MNDSLMMDVSTKEKDDHDETFRLQVLNDLQYHLSIRNGEEKEILRDVNTTTTTVVATHETTEQFLPTTTTTTTSEPQRTRNQSSSSSSSSSSSFLLDNTAMAIPVAAMKTLLNVVQRSTSETMMGLQHELQIASQIILTHDHHHHQDHDDSNNNNNNYTPSSYRISLQSGIELFLHYITRSYLESPGDFHNCRSQILQRGQQFQLLSYTARDRIAVLVAKHLSNSTIIGTQDHHHHHQYHSDRTTTTTTSSMTILTFGFSRVVAAILYELSKTKHFDLIVVEGSSSSCSYTSSTTDVNNNNNNNNNDDCDGGNKNRMFRTAQCYCDEMNIPVTVVPEAAMGYILEERNVSMVLVGSYVIVENGGLFNKCGTYTLAMCAYTMNIPFYVAAESYKFARLYPLHQSDIPYNENNRNDDYNNNSSSSSNNSSSIQYNPTATEAAINQNHGLQQQQLQQKLLQLQIRNPYVDYTPAKYITLFFTDLGILTTSAVSDELIRLYQ
jgi:translation initiation factor eIF-2B subunit alpha